MLCYEWLSQNFILTMWFFYFLRVLHVHRNCGFWPCLVTFLSLFQLVLNDRFWYKILKNRLRKVTKTCQKPSIFSLTQIVVIKIVIMGSPHTVLIEYSSVHFIHSGKAWTQVIVWVKPVDLQIKIFHLTIHVDLPSFNLFDSSSNNLS